MTLLLRGGTVHSAEDPFATAVLVERGVIAWIGQEAGADAVLRRESDSGQDVDVIDLDGALLTPAFADAWAGAATPEQQREGIPALGLVSVSPQPPAGPRVLSGVDSLDPAALSGLTAAGAQLLAHPEAEPGPGFSALPLADVVAAGIPLALASGPGPARNPWTTIAAAVTSGPAPLTARAAFNAHARGAWRVAGHPRSAEMGRIAIGCDASLAAWQVAALAVQTPDERIASWSTDPRAGTPLLPALGPGEPLPHCTLTMREGQVVYTSVAP